MSTIKHVAESTENPPSVGRIAPLNMASEANRLNHESIIRDLATADGNDHNDQTPACNIVSWA